jgi:hypothetical protein
MKLQQRIFFFKDCLVLPRHAEGPHYHVDQVLSTAHADPYSVQRQVAAFSTADAGSNARSIRLQ